MKKIKIISIFLAIIMLFGFTSCGEEEISPVKFENDVSEHSVTGTLHNFNVQENAERTFIVGGKTDYKIVSEPKNKYAASAYNFIVKNVNRATGVTLQVEFYEDDMENSWSSSDKVIVLNCLPIFEKAGLTMPSYSVLGVSGYYIKTVGNTVFIMTQGIHGYQLGAYKFLEEVIGYDMLGEDLYVFEKTGATIPDMEITERPDVDYRASSATATIESYYGMGYNLRTYSDLFMGVPENPTESSPIPVHNSFNYLPPSIYSEAHPDWFWKPGDMQEEQLCYTAHGKDLTAEEDALNGVPNEYTLMVQTLYSWLKHVVDENPELNNITITHQDNRSYCKCNRCKAIEGEYGSITAAYIRFLNDVDDLLQADLEYEAEQNGTEKRDVNVLFFAYHGTKYPPTKYDETVRFNEHVGLIIAPIESYYTSTFYEEINWTQGEAKLIDDWSKFSNRILYWLYETSYGSPGAYFYPYNSWDSIVETYRFVVERGALWVWNEGQNGQRTPSCWMALKNYTDAKALVNVNVNYKDLEQKFFKYYFGAGGDAMYKFFKEVQTTCAYIETIDSTVTGRLSTAVNKTNLWPRETLIKWEGYVQQAYDLIDAEYAITGDANARDIAKKKVMIESLSPRYILLDLYSATFSEQEKYERRLAFKKDNDSIGNTREAESSELSGLYLAWGL